MENEQIHWSWKSAEECGLERKRKEGSAIHSGHPLRSGQEGQEGSMGLCALRHFQAF